MYNELCFRITMETAGLPLPGYHYIAPNHIVKAPIHWMGLRGQNSGGAYKLYNSDRSILMQPQYGTLAPIYFFKWTWQKQSLLKKWGEAIGNTLDQHWMYVYICYEFISILDILILILHYLIDWSRMSVIYISVRPGEGVENNNYCKKNMTDILKF